MMQVSKVVREGGNYTTARLTVSLWFVQIQTKGKDGPHGRNGTRLDCRSRESSEGPHDPGLGAECGDFPLG